MIRIQELFSIFAILAICMIFTFPESFALETATFQINEEIALEKTVMTMNIPKDSKLPWGFVEGKIENPVKEYPVIIQIFQNEDPIHFAQVPVNHDNTYEYKFRVKAVNNDRVTNIFEGDYTVKIFKVVYSASGPII